MSCSGIEPSCHWWASKGASYSYTMMIDVDGPPDPDKKENMDPFLAYCDFGEGPGIGVTTLPAMVSYEVSKEK